MLPFVLFSNMPGKTPSGQNNRSRSQREQVLQEGGERLERLEFRASGETEVVGGKASAEYGNRLDPAGTSVTQTGHAFRRFTLQLGRLGRQNHRNPVPDGTRHDQAEIQQ